MRLPRNRFNLEELPRIILHTPNPNDRDRIPQFIQFGQDVRGAEMIFPFSWGEGDDGVFDLRRCEGGRVKWGVGMDSVLSGKIGFVVTNGKNQSHL